MLELCSKCNQPYLERQKDYIVEVGQLLGRVTVCGRRLDVEAVKYMVYEQPIPHYKCNKCREEVFGDIIETNWLESRIEVVFIDPFSKNILEIKVIK